MKRQHRTLHALSCAIALSLAAPVALAAGLQYERVNLGTLVEGESYNEFIVKYREGSAQRERPAQHLSEAVGLAWRQVSGTAAAGVTYVRRMAVGADVIRLPAALDGAQATQLMQQIAADPAVEYVEPVVRMERFSPPGDPRWAEQWHYHTPAESAGGVNLVAAWPHGRGEGVVVAVIDTGVTEHPDLAANVLMDEGYDFILRQPGGADPGDWEDLEFGSTRFLITPSSWHGTHVAGTVAAVTDNGIGVAGVAPDAVVLPVRVLGSAGGTNVDIADAIVWSVGGAVEGAPENRFPAEVINMSLGSGAPRACPNVYKDALAEAHRRNVTVVVAAGNSAGNAAGEWGTGYTMANCSDEIIVVGGVGPTGTRGGVSRTGEIGASGSNHGGRIDLAAPYGIGFGKPGADDILSTLNTGERGPEEPSYAFYYGTSMASPHVAGAVALMQSVAPERLRPDQVKRILQDTARAFPVALDKPLGAGILDVEAAVLAAQQTPCDETEAGCGPLPAQQLFDAVPLTPLSGDDEGERFYSFEARAGSVLNILASGGTGTAALHVAFDRVPTADTYDFRSVRPGTNQVVRIAAPKAGTYHIRLSGEYARLTLRAQQAR
ncbi:S8 family serine peptidase [Luteimonas abyssi]|uniref:S8 family serine peptidase n=1 Tax=Luteimonas abyssi TaxID=1247514 RepID=UPI000737C53B|nr:S8 family serine peptidase [Luteimonas abyssi]